MKRNPYIYYSKKIGMLLLSVFVLSLLVFYMSRLAPGDPLVAYYGERAEKMNEDERQQTRERLGLDKPIYVQYGVWLENAVQGVFGVSYKYKQDVMEVINKRIGNTLILGGIGFGLTFALALALGLFCAIREDSAVDKICCQLGTASSCIPTFWMALMLILVFSVWLGWLPSSGAYTLGQSSSLSSRITHLVLPMVVLILSHLWYYSFMIRNKLLAEIRQDYVLLAKAKGLTRRQIVCRHCLRNIMPAYISLMAISVPHILGGTYVIEIVFSYPGIGTLSFESAKYHDYNMLMILCLITGVTVILCNIIGQIINERIDPRMKAIEVIPETEAANNG